MNLLLISVALYAISCCLPALEFKNSSSPNDVMLGMRALAVGWSGIFGGVAAWYANPFWVLSILLAWFRKPAFALVAAGIAVAIASTIFSDLGRDLPGDEGGVTRTAIFRLLPGFYVWVASMIAVPLLVLAQRVWK
jgi:hypothetical protein